MLSIRAAQVLDWLTENHIYTKDQIAAMEARSAERATVQAAAGKWRRLASLNARGKC